MSSPKKSGHIQPKIREKLAEKKCSLIGLLEKRQKLFHHKRTLQNKVIEVRKNALTTICEDFNPKLPKMPGLSKKRKLASWVKSL